MLLESTSDGHGCQQPAAGCCGSGPAPLLTVRAGTGTLTSPYFLGQGEPLPALLPLSLEETVLPEALLSAGQRWEQVASGMGKACEAGSARGHALAHTQQCWNLSRQAGGCSLKVYWMQGRFPGMPRQRHLPTCRLETIGPQLLQARSF